MTQNEGQNFGSSSRALGAFDQRGPYGILIHLGVDFVKMNESQFRAENPAAKYPLPYRQQLLKNITYEWLRYRISQNRFWWRYRCQDDWEKTIDNLIVNLDPINFGVNLTLVS